MAFYCDHTVRFRGRLVKINCRYCSIQSVKILKGKPLPALTEEKDLYCSRFFAPNNPIDHVNTVFRALFRLLRRKGVFDASGHCDCGRYC